MTSNTGTVPHLWHTQEDDALLCDECGVKELNSSFLVAIGLVEPYESMEHAQERFVDLDGIEGDYFVKVTEGRCVACGADAVGDEDGDAA